MADEAVQRFEDKNLRGAQFVRSTLAGAVMRGVDVRGLDIDAPWLADGPLIVNGVDVMPLVEAELNRRFPGRELKGATDPMALRAAWVAIEQAWAAAVQRAVSLPEGSVDRSVNGEWSFAQTLRHLAFATDAWLRKAILSNPQPFHPFGQPNVEYETDGYDMGVFADRPPTFDEVLALRADRQTMVRDFLAAATPELLAQNRTSAWDPEYEQSVLSCLHVIFDEEWEHLRYALRDLDAVTTPQDQRSDR